MECSQMEDQENVLAVIINVLNVAEQIIINVKNVIVDSIYQEILVMINALMDNLQTELLNLVKDVIKVVDYVMDQDQIHVLNVPHLDLKKDQVVLQHALKENSIIHTNSYSGAILIAKPVTHHVKHVLEMDLINVHHVISVDISKEINVILHALMDYMEIIKIECVIHAIQVVQHVLDQMIINVMVVKKDFS